jgi:pimeloyl-ACP methyl ester carboxylesterase
MARPPGPPLPPARRVELPGRGITWVYDTGPRPGAPVVVLLHGWAVTAALNWFPSFGPLSRRYRVIALDHRGHGRGIRTKRAFRLADCADDVAALAGVLGVDSIVPVGYSMGGPVAQLVWHRHPDLVSGLVLCATSGSFRGSAGENVFLSMLPALGFATRVTPGVSRRWLASWLVTNRLGEGPMADWIASELRGNDPAAVLEAGGSLGRFTSARWIGGLDVPAAVVITERDGLVPPSRQRALAAAIPGVSVHAIAADHGACVARPDLFVPALLDACQSVTARMRARH